MFLTRISDIRSSRNPPAQSPTPENPFIDYKCTLNNFSPTDLLASFGVQPSNSRNVSYVLVLGAGGLVGSALTKSLQKSGYNILVVNGRNHLDLRKRGALQIFDDLNISFCFFMSYEVGGAKYLQSPEIQDEMYQSNLDMMDAVFDWLKKRNIRFIFASSSLAADAGLYGKAKLKGEGICANMSSIARVVRFWNVYGWEFSGIKSHIVPDFIFQCVDKNHATGRTDGTELRQFTHVDDISAALIIIMNNFEKSDLILDLSDGKWVDLKLIGKTIEDVIPNCKIQFSEKKPMPQTRHQPKTDTYFHQNLWAPKVSLTEGISITYEQMKEYYQNLKKIDLSIIVRPRDIKTIDPEFQEYLKSVLDRLKPFNVEIIELESNDRKTLQKAIDLKANGLATMILFDDIYPDISQFEIFKKKQSENNFIYVSQIIPKDFPEPKMKPYSTTEFFDSCRPTKIPFIYSDYVSGDTKLFQSLPKPINLHYLHYQLMSLGKGYVGVQMSRRSRIKNN